MDNATYTQSVVELVRGAMESSSISVNSLAKQAGIPYTTLDRRLRGVSDFTVDELRRIAQVTGVSTRSFIPAEVSA